MGKKTYSELVKSHGEELVESALLKMNIEFFREYTFDGLGDKRPFRFDFYIPKYNLCIEFDGIQHFAPVEVFGGMKAFNETQKRDKIKNRFCEENNIELLRISYKEMEDIEQIIKKKTQGELAS